MHIAIEHYFGVITLNNMDCLVLIKTN